MKNFIGYDRFANVLSDSEFEDFRTLTKMIVQANREENSCTQEVVCVLETDSQPKKKLTILCTGIRDLKVKDFGPGEIVIKGLECIDHRKSQPDNAAWQISDYESGKLSFYCSQIEIMSAEHKETALHL